MSQMFQYEVRPPSGRRHAVHRRRTRQKKRNAFLSGASTVFSVTTISCFDSSVLVLLVVLCVVCGSSC